MMSGPLRFLRWFYFGLGLKRWLLLAVIGCVLFVNGLTRWFVAEGAHFPFNEYVDNAMSDFGVPLGSLSYAFIAIGAIFVFVGIRQWMRSIVVASERREAASA